MSINYEELMALKNLGQTYRYGERDVMLYALAIGMGSDPMNEQELAFVNEIAATPRPLKVVPTFASIAAGFAEPGDMNLNSLALDGERDITFHNLLPSAAHGLADSFVTGVYDKGKDNGAVIRYETVLKDSRAEPLATLVTSYFAPHDGGFGGPSIAQPKPHQIPTRTPDRTVDIPTRLDQGLIYRLCGDRHPLHSDPEYARRAGFCKPILHGLCTYGISCRGILSSYADYDPNAIKRHAARFSAPVYPGDIVTLDIWKDDDVISFEARVEARGVKVIKHGITVLG
ncbi:MaoC family dehydratase [Bradyrhizobium canariense]|uniref:3-alpha,7-alpha, 12-alpha-trihydroxy-5-beta-cholest-24-enoyl-CoA hydratase n=1 Tax=Bradyrhizobium canariense TaxID=255045 RepID=A0A1X3GQ45_9BRAD|nr:MaoC family dehydratase [Bradyrhizobium canariense]OSI73171.1 3-alpha,7-alpha,12-alpha-trihydroxy-5-beta-cholest-24-enoyl-CoA hydratase [Bradyrhizobium canariense]OSI81273.1 3-alpha,7-alpha,12-alpha-trihydroxy-5-beta-cholest-24-enoyl-CoA hydratase [Bradyrhizobium canariense]OSI94548.1 3-alpha,7-alpha,12-alpha-trihydroxy-5-beta-cholest-24-enoyl-CoA hydratase [Bradyrhizobium canariense]OSI95136.1 3-alpha,7-alpha,12-alpha-trihydroxy-5-beta-cholest-24-enoyl-CoA hydratase [Bradyrhizobium canarien